MSLRKRLPLLSLVIALVLLVAVYLNGCNVAQTGDASAKNSDAVATYKGGSVSRAEFEKQFNFERKLVDPSFEETDANKEQFLKEYVTLHKVLVEQAKQEGVKVDENSVKDSVQEYKDQVVELSYGGDQTAFEDALQKYGITDADLQEMVRHDQYLKGLRAKKVGSLKATEDEAKTFFDKNKGLFASGTVSQIIVRTQDEAKQVRERLAKGEDLAKVASEVSLDPLVKQNGGTLTNVQFDQFEPAFYNQAATLPLNTLSQPFRTSYGWHILRVDQRIEPSYTQAKKAVLQKASEEKQNVAWDAIYAKAQEDAQIQIHLPK